MKRMRMKKKMTIRWCRQALLPTRTHQECVCRRHCESNDARHGLRVKERRRQPGCHRQHLLVESPHVMPLEVSVGQ